MSKPIDITVFKPTDDGWYPSFYLIKSARVFNAGHDFLTWRLVQVKFIELLNNQGWRVLVVGGDNTEIAKDYPFDQKEQAFDGFINLISRDKVNYKETFDFLRTPQ